MKKRLIAFLCALTLFAGLLPAGNVAAASEEATEQQYLVGYAIESINPDASLVGKLQLTGNGDDNTRFWDGTLDDFGGISATCVCITDNQDNTVMIISVDMCKGYNSISDIAHRQKIIDELNKRLAGEGKEPTSLAPDQIIITASHTHSGPNTDTLDNYSEDDPRYDYYQSILSQLEEVAINAYLDRKPAWMKRGSVDAKQATKELYPATGFEGYEMNFIRQYTLTTTYSDGTSKKFMNDSSVGHGKLFGDYKTATRGAIYEADHTMQLLTFEFDASAGKEPIVMLNWSAHPTTNSSSATNTISSDYVGALRHYLNQEGYRAAFIQGAGANTTITSLAWDVTDWTERVPAGGSKTDIYGQILANVALHGINECMTDYLPAREITNLQKPISLNRQDHGDAYYKAVMEINKLKEDGKTVSYPYRSAENNVNINFAGHATQIINRHNEIYDEIDGTWVKVDPTRNQTVNVISLGNAALFVTSPSEMADYYNTYVNGELAEFYAPDTPNTQPNKWDELVNNATYGAPFVISNANGNNGYMPNAMSYDYNKEYNGSDYTDAENVLAPGSYEANTSYFARGSGEALLDAYKEMIAEVDKKVARCEACGEDATWTPIYASNAITGAAWESGHYYLRDDLSNYAGGTIQRGETICLDLNGKQVSCSGRFFLSENVASGTPAYLNIIDSMNTAKVTSMNGNDIGGLFFMKQPFTLSIYGGTFASNGAAKRGGIAFVAGVLNLYGGTIQGGQLTTVDGKGGAVSVSSQGSLYVYGGEILNGECLDGAVGSCVYLEDQYSRIYLQGEAEVADIYFSGVSGYNLTINDVYTGEANLTIPTAQNAMDIGNITAGANITNANITINHNEDWDVVVRGTNLLLINNGTVALIGSTEYTSLQEALDACNGTTVKLVRDVYTDVNVEKNAYLDLNGHSVFGALTVAEGNTLYCMDSQTDDYTVADENGNLTGYGKLANASGNVVGYEFVTKDSNGNDDGYAYLKVTETDGVSFHRVHLNIYQVNLDTSVAGIYYTSTFEGDELIAENVSRFGVVLSIEEVPDEENMEKSGTYSYFKNFKAGKNANEGTGTTLKGIMKENNHQTINSRNAEMEIYGRPYILTTGGDYLFGVYKKISLKDFVIAYNKMGGDQSALTAMYQTYKNVMSSWGLTNIPGMDQ